MHYHIWLQCASEKAPTAANPRQFSWGIHRDGYGPILDRLMRVLSPGMRVMLHNPFGKPSSPGAKMEFDQQLNCENAGLSHIVKSFEKSVASLTKAAADVIAYLGAPHNTPRMTTLIQGAPASLDNWLWNVWRSLRLPLELGCSIAFDNFGGEAITVYETRLAHFVDSLCRLYGRRLYIEATTRFDSPLHDQFPMFVLDEKFDERHEPPQHPVVRGKLPLVGSETWYLQDVYPLFQTGHFGNDQSGRNKLIARVEAYNQEGISPFVTLPLAERLEELA